MSGDTAVWVIFAVIGGGALALWLGALAVSWRRGARAPVGAHTPGRGRHGARGGGRR